MDFGHRAHRRARILRRGLLLDGDRRRQTVDLVYVRLLHHFEELARVGREGLDIAALALGVDRVEGERGLARAGEAGEHHQMVARNGEIDVLEVVLARAADHDRPPAEQGVDGFGGLGRANGARLRIGSGHGGSWQRPYSLMGRPRARESRLRASRADVRTNVERGQKRFSNAPGPAKVNVVAAASLPKRPARPSVDKYRRRTIGRADVRPLRLRISARRPCALQWAAARRATWRAASTRSFWSAIWARTPRSGGSIRAIRW